MVAGTNACFGARVPEAHASQPDLDDLRKFLCLMLVFLLP